MNADDEDGYDTEVTISFRSTRGRVGVDVDIDLSQVVGGLVGKHGEAESVPRVDGNDVGGGARKKWEGEIAGC